MHVYKYTEFLRFLDVQVYMQNTTSMTFTSYCDDRIDIYCDVSAMISFYIALWQYAAYMTDYWSHIFINNHNIHHHISPQTNIKLIKQ